MRAHEAVGEDFSVAAATQAITGVLGDKDALITRDTEISTWANAVYGDVWHPFYGGGHWNVGSVLLDLLEIIMIQDLLNMPSHLLEERLK